MPNTQIGTSHVIGNRPGSEGLRTKRSGHGFHTFIVDDYAGFGRVAENYFRGDQRFVWRGARDPNWHLMSTLTRTLRTWKVENWERKTSQRTTRHLHRFLLELRGIYEFTSQHLVFLNALERLLAEKERTFPSILSELHEEQRQLVFEMFSLGQHHGLSTPLLDWTRSPYVALYFAFSESDNRADDVGYRTIYALNRPLVETVCPLTEAINDRTIRFVDSIAFRNPRILGQSGLFTYSPTHTSIEDWVTREFHGQHDKPVLLRFLIQNSMRHECLEWLSTMNINPRTLFPDLLGASKESNYHLELQVKPDPTSI